MKTLILLTLLALSGQAAAQDSGKTSSTKGGNIWVQSLAEQEIRVKKPDGSTEMQRQPVGKAVPGTEVIYTTRFTNQGKEAANDIVINNPISRDTAYVGGSAFGEHADITFSLDGKTFAAPAALKVTTPEGKERLALPSEYAHIRWARKSPLPPGHTGEVGFRVKIK